MLEVVLPWRSRHKVPPGLSKMHTRLHNITYPSEWLIWEPLISESNNSLSHVNDWTPVYFFITQERLYTSMTLFDIFWEVWTQCKEYYGEIRFRINKVGPVPVSDGAFTLSGSVIWEKLCCMSSTHYEYQVFKIYFVWHNSICKLQWISSSIRNSMSKIMKELQNWNLQSFDM